MEILDAQAAKPLEGGASFSLSNRLERLVWRCCWALLARWTPPSFSSWRILLLSIFGARVGPGAAIAASVKVWLPRNLDIGAHSAIGPDVDCYNMAQIKIGEYSVISQGSFLCAGTHDIADPNFQLKTRPIDIGDRVWIAAQSFIGPGVSVGDGAVLAARGAAFTDLAAWTVYRGNPAEIIKIRKLRTEEQR